MDWMYVPVLLYLQNELDVSIKVHPEENDGVRLFTAMNGLEDTAGIVQLLGTLEGP